MANLKTIRFDRELHSTVYSQIEEGEDLVQVIDDELIDKDNLKELKKQRADLAEARRLYREDLLAPFQTEKLSDEKIKELKERVTELRQDNEMRNLDKDKEEEARMDIKKVKEDFQTAFPAFLQKEVEMDK